MRKDRSEYSSVPDFPRFSIDINAATDSSESVQETRFKQSGVTLAVSSPLISSMQTMQQMGEASSKVKDPRMKAMAAANAGMAAKGAVDAAQPGRQFSHYYATNRPALP
jgi:filamentous hemagglutinin